MPKHEGKPIKIPITLDFERALIGCYLLVVSCLLEMYDFDGIKQNYFHIWVAALMFVYNEA